MKNTFLLLLFLLPTLILAQADDSNGTSLEEYRFLTKGYVYQMEMGIDPHKDGYEIKTIGKSNNDVKYLGLFKAELAVPQGILLVFNAETAEPTFICLPNNQANKRVWELYEMDRKAIVDPDIWEGYDAAMRDLTFQLMGASTGLSSQNSKTDLSESSDKELPESYADTSNSTEKESSANSSKKKIKVKSTDKWVAKGDELTESEKTSGQEDDKINPSVNITMDAAIVNTGVVEAPVIRGLYKGRGILVIKFCFDQNGDVSQARYTMMGSTTYKENLKQLALESVRKAKFAPSSKSEQCGKVTFHFK